MVTIYSRYVQKALGVTGDVYFVFFFQGKNWCHQYYLPVEHSTVGNHSIVINSRSFIVHILNFSFKIKDSFLVSYLEAMRGKYRISEDRYQDFYNRLVRPKLVDFLSDERKRWRKSNQSANRSTSPVRSDSTSTNNPPTVPLSGT